MKNITFSAEDHIIQAARKQAAIRGKTLNDEFRSWLTIMATPTEQRAHRYRELMQRLSHVNAGKKFSRNEMNQR